MVPMTGNEKRKKKRYARRVRKRQKKREKQVKCMDEVKRINGAVRFEDAYECI